MSLRSTLAAAVAVSSLLLAPALTHAQGHGGSCTVSPNPAALGTYVTVTVSGLKPNTVYMIGVEEPGNGYTLNATSDASGNAVWTDPYALNVAGTYTFDWFATMREAMHNQSEASCTATVQ